MLGKFFVLGLVAAGIVSAAAAPASTTKCAAQTIVDKCVQDMTNIANKCSQTDYKCLCEAHKNILTCYNNCPNDPNKGIEESTVSAWCVAAGGDAPTTSTTPLATTSTSSSAAVESSIAGSSSSEAAPTETVTSKPTVVPTGSVTSTATATKTTPKASGTSPTPSSTAGAGSAIRPMGYAAGAIAAAALLL